MKAGKTEIGMGIATGILGLYVMINADGIGTFILSALFSAIGVSVCLTIGLVKNKKAIRNEQVASETEYKRKWIHEMRRYRFQTWINAVRKSGAIVAVRSIIPNGFVCRSNEMVFLTNRSCNLYESQKSYTTNIVGDLSAYSSSYSFSKNGINKALYASNPLRGLISDTATLTETTGQFAAVATTVSCQKKQLVSTGMLIVTNRRIIFLGNHQNRVFNIDEIMFCNGDESYLVVSAENYDKVVTIEAFDAAIFRMIINMLHDDVNLREQYDIPAIYLPQEPQRPCIGKCGLTGRSRGRL